MKALFPLSLLALCASSAHAVIDLGSASSDATHWVGINYLNTSDPTDDAQTSNGGGEADLVGGEFVGSGGEAGLSGTYYALYKGFDFGTGATGTEFSDLQSDASIAFRARVGGDDNPGGFDTALWLGIDLGVDGSFDYFIGLYNNASPSDTDLGLYQFTDPADTLVDTKKANYTEVTTWGGRQTGNTFDFSAGTGSDSFTLGSSVGDPVDIDQHPSALAPDYLVQFELDFSDLADAMGLTTEEFFNTQIAFGLWTSQNLNQVNNDINGIGDYTGDPDLTPSNPYTPSGGEVPEPSSYALIFGALALAFSASRRRK